MSQIDEFLDWHKGRVLRRTGKPPAESTLESKASRLRTALAHSGLEGWDCLGTQTSDPVFMERLLDRIALATTTGNARLCFDALKNFNEYAQVKGWAESNGLAGLEPPPRNPQKVIKVYTDAEVDMLVMAARGVSLRWWALLMTLARTGRRVGEVLKLEWDWLRADAEPPHFELPYRTKNGRQAFVPLGPTLTASVYTSENMDKLISGEGNREFVRDVTKFVFPWSYSTAAKMFDRHCRRCDIENRGFHNFRHTKATSMLAQGVPIQAVSSLLGHASVATTDRKYNHANALAYAEYVD